MNETNKVDFLFVSFCHWINSGRGLVDGWFQVQFAAPGKVFFFDFQNIESRIRKDETHNNQKKIESILLEKYHLIIEANFFIISGLKLLKKANYRKILFFWAKKDNFCWMTEKEGILLKKFQFALNRMYFVILKHF